VSKLSWGVAHSYSLFYVMKKTIEVSKTCDMIIISFIKLNCTHQLKQIIRMINEWRLLS